MLKKRTILGIVAALAALGAVFAMSGVIYADAPTAGQAAAGVIIDEPDDVQAVVHDGGSVVYIYNYIEQGSSGTAGTSASAVNGYGAVADAESNSFIQDNGVGSVYSTASATASGLGSEAVVTAVSVIGNSEDGGGSPPPTTSVAPGGKIFQPSTGTVNSVANGAAANGGEAVAMATGEIADGGSGNITAYAVANSTGGDALSNTSIIIGPDGETQAPGFYWDAYASGDSAALAVLYVPAENNIVAFTFTNAGSTDAVAVVIAHGSDVPFVYAGG